MEQVLVSSLVAAAAASPAPFAVALPAALRLVPRAGHYGGSSRSASASPAAGRAYATTTTAAAAAAGRPSPRPAPAAAALAARAAALRRSGAATATYASSAAAEAALKPAPSASAIPAEAAAAPFPTGPPGKVDVAAWLDAHARPYTGDASFLSGPTPRTLALWSKAEELLAQERANGGVLSCDPKTPATITSHAPGYIDRELELIVGLQTDAPLKRAIKPKGGVATVKQALEARGYSLDPEVERIFSEFRKTQNQAIFDSYTADVRAARSSGLLTGLPDAYGRGRIIGDYRRVALYGVDALIAAKEADLNAADLSASPMTEEKVRLREEVREQVRALQALKEMAASYGCDVSRPARTAREAVQWLYLGYLAAIKEQDGAAMSLGRIDAFLDLYIERDLQSGVLQSEAEAQELIDDLVIKLRLTRQLRTPDYDALFAGDPTWATLAIGGADDRGNSRVTKTAFRLLQTLRNLGPAPEPNMTVLWDAASSSGSGSGGGSSNHAAAQQQQHFREFAARVSIETSSIQFENDALMRREAGFGGDYSIACCVSAMRTGKDLQLFGARTNLAKALLYAINGGRDEITGKQVGPRDWPALKGDETTPLDYSEVASVFYGKTLPWLADLYAKAMNIIHAQHDKYNYEAAQLSLMDTRLRRLIAFGVSGFSVVADSLSAIKHARVYPKRDPKSGLVTDFRIEGDFPKYGNDEDRVDALAVEVLERFYSELKRQHTYRGAEPTLSVLTITSNVAYGKRTGATPDGRARGVPFAPGANPLHGRDASGALASLASVAKLPYAPTCLDGISNTFSLVVGGLGRGGEAERAGNLVRVLDGYFESGGMHLNVNVLSRDQLLDAMEHPERYPSLTIRVSGYAVRFVSLSREQQLEVLNRTMFEELA